MITRDEAWALLLESPEHEIGRLRDEIERLEAEIERLGQVIAFGVDMRIALAQEKDAEIERLQEALRGEPVELFHPSSREAYRDDRVASVRGRPCFRL